MLPNHISKAYIKLMGVFRRYNFIDEQNFDPSNNYLRNYC